MPSTTILRWRRRLGRMLDNYRAARMRAAALRTHRDAIRARCTALQHATALAQAVAAQVQSSAHSRIAALVTQCLQVFDEPYVFRIDFHRARGRTEARLVFMRDGVEVDPLTASGGGVVDVAAFALRVSCLLASKPALARVLILDEPFRFVSAHYRPRIRALIEDLAISLHMQFIIVTHDTALRCGRLVELP